MTITSVDEAFEWDEDKAEANIKNHGIRFEEAMSVFTDFGLTTRDDESHSEYEQREIATGYSLRLRLLTVVFTERNGKTRIISARLSTSYERKLYESG
jgi:uncharacterized DUF497 family protein